MICAAISRLGRNGLPPGVSGLGTFFRIIFERGLPFIAVCTAGLVWGVVSFQYVAPRILPDFWAERGLVEFGTSIGATSTGLLLLRMADPESKTPVLRDFTLKQIFHVLITGGGFFDVLVPIPVTATTMSCWPLLVVSLLAIFLCLACHPRAGRGLLRCCLGSRAEAPITTTSAVAVFATPSSATSDSATPTTTRIPTPTERDAYVESPRVEIVSPPPPTAADASASIGAPYELPVVTVQFASNDDTVR